MRKTGLFDFLENYILNNLVDYVTGVETGLDSNGRKNRGGILWKIWLKAISQKQDISIAIHTLKRCIYTI